MDPKILDFLYLNGFVLFILVLYMTLWRPKRQPSRLKFRSGPTGGQSPVVRHASVGNSTATHKNDRKERQLNVIFQFNGHNFDAHEALGVPAGSSIEKVEHAYKNAINNSETESHEFYRHAYESILKATVQLLI